MKANFFLKAERPRFFSSELVTYCDMNDPGKSYFSNELQEIDSPYFSLENLKTFPKELKDKTFFICL